MYIKSLIDLFQNGTNLNKLYIISLNLFKLHKVLIPSLINIYRKLKGSFRAHEIYFLRLFFYKI